MLNQLEESSRKYQSKINSSHSGVFCVMPPRKNPEASRWSNYLVYLIYEAWRLSCYAL
jgi:hypothetical protein